MNPELANPNKTKYLWKYLTLHKFIYLLKTSNLYFSRLDLLPDVLEGTPMGVIERRYYEDEHADLHKEEVKKIAKHSQTKEEYVQEMMNFQNMTEEESSKKTQFVNSWFACDRESVAMWNLYSQIDSIAIRVENMKFVEIFQSPIEEFIKKFGNRHYVIGDYISYYNLHPFDPKQKIYVRYSGMKKDNAYSHEKEYRMLIADKGIQDDNIGLEIHIPNLKDAEVTIITNPLIESWQFDNIKSLIELFNFNAKLIRSEIKYK
jgi:hypothetical protein